MEKPSELHTERYLAHMISDMLGHGITIYRVGDWYQLTVNGKLYQGSTTIIALAKAIAHTMD